MWGGTPDRNMLSSMKGIPTTWDLKTKKNVKWMAQLGSQSYGNPVVAGGQVYAGTNNELVRNPKEPGDRGVLMCFRESDRKSTRLNSSHLGISYAVFCLKKKNKR